MVVICERVYLQRSVRGGRLRCPGARADVFDLLSFCRRGLVAGWDAEMLLDLGQVMLYLLHVLGVGLEKDVLHAQQDDGLDEELEPFALPVLERRTPELRPELAERERLTVLAGLVADLDQ